VGGKRGPASRDRLPSLTGLRFWAALLVVLYHLSSDVAVLTPVSEMVRFGRTGVTFFFVLSGFVLAWTYIDDPVPVRVFLWRRFARVWPALALSGVMALAVLAISGYLYSVSHLLAMFTFLQGWRVEWTPSANGSWSLSDEAFFYLLFPALLAVAQHRRGRTVLVIVCGVAMVGVWVASATYGWESFWVDYFPPARLAQFVLGVVCGAAMKRGRRAIVGFRTAVVIAVMYHAILLGWAERIDPQGGFGAYVGSQWWAAPVFALLVMAAAQADLEGERTPLRDPWSLRLGHWSYCWYLLHGIVIQVWSALDMGSGGLNSGIAAWVAIVVVSLALAGAMFSWWERPAERWLRGLPPGSVERANPPH
jgi:peptidoglycan/LPS O-acetylase OafA/YrhL